MSSTAPSFWRRYVPGVSGNPVRLAWKLLREPNPAARNALYLAIGGILMAPIDRLLAMREARLIAPGARPPQPVILVCGPPRSGTTVCAHFLIDTLETDYLSNWTSLFPRAPLVARHLVRRRLGHRQVDYDAYYGRSRGLDGANDALYLWDRWLGTDRDATPLSLVDGSAEALPAFFAAMQHQSGLPTVNKVNRLVSCADLVAEVLPEARFICLRRDPVQLASSLLVARSTIVGDPSRPYGPSPAERVIDDPVEDVCRQVEQFHEQTVRQQQRLGSDRFVVLDYEAFCRDPAHERDNALTQLGVQVTPRRPAQAPTTFRVSTAQRLSDTDVRRLEQRLSGLGNT